MLYVTIHRTERDSQHYSLILYIIYVFYVAGFNYFSDCVMVNIDEL